jgi:acyl-CoA thioester hydrolase
MESFVLPIQLRWADMDANRHLRHSAYYDFGALARTTLFNKLGITIHLLEELHMGPILFREEAIFRREIRFEDQIAIDTLLAEATRDYSRWTVRHRITKTNNELAATLTLDGAWIDLIKRKLAVPPESIHTVYDQFPRAEDFKWRE